jgi:GNAT superfamily N-acetyltransferase
MSTVIQPIGIDQLAEYAQVPSVCDVRSILIVEELTGSTWPSLREQPIKAPYTKDYDSYPEGGPLKWPQRFDLSNWGLWLARDGGEAAGGAAMACNTASLQILEDRADVAALWDIRVRPSYQRAGIGTALFREAAQWAKSKGCRLLKIETQNVNVAACRFYARMGCSLARIDHSAYNQTPGLVGEVMLIWHLDLSS